MIGCLIKIITYSGNYNDITIYDHLLIIIILTIICPML